MTADVFQRLTDKQLEAMELAASGLTSKEIARELDISPHSVDKRIDAVRSRLDSMPRNQLVREFRNWNGTGDQITGERSPLTHPTGGTLESDLQLAGETLLFDDSAAHFPGHAGNRPARRLHRGISPSDLGTGWRLLLVLAGAFLAAAPFVLVAAAGNVLVDLLG